MSDIKDKLRGLLNTPGLSTGADVAKRVDEMKQKRAEGAFEIDRVVSGEVVENKGGAFYLVRHEFPLDTMHGPVSLGDVLNSASDHIAFSANDDELVDFDPRRAAFMDTETGGLVGGAGNVAFLIGLGYFTDDAFILDQCFMRDYDEEEGMLHYLDERLSDMDTVVSYNGKTFDVPLMRNRFIQNRIPYRLDAAMHFDLLHTARRFWKRRIQDCSLSNVEREILGMPRHDDVSGALIPQLWFDYLRSRDARPLERVFYHHKMDIMSLVALTAWVAQCLDSPDGFCHAEDRLSLARVYFRQKKYDDVIPHVNKVLEADAPPAIRHEAIEMLAIAAKRTGDFDVMEEAWTLMLREFPRDLEARRELAIHCEHRKRDLPAAAEHCEAALQFLETRQALGRSLGIENTRQTEFAHRLERIQRKLTKKAGHADDLPDSAL